MFHCLSVGSSRRHQYNTILNLFSGFSLFTFFCFICFHLKWIMQQSLYKKQKKKFDFDLKKFDSLLINCSTRTAWEDLKYCGTELHLLEWFIWNKVEEFRVTFGQGFRVRILGRDFNPFCIFISKNFKFWLFSLLEYLKNWTLKKKI